MPSAGPGPVLTSPAAMGSGVGAALEGAGDAVHASQLRAYQVQREQDRQSQAADFYHKLAQTQQANDALVQQLRSGAEPGGAGHVQNVAAALEKQGQDLFGGITEQSVMQAARQQWESYATGMVRGAQDWAEGQRIGKTVSDSLNTVNVTVNRLMHTDDPQALAQTLALFENQAAHMPVPPDVRDKFLRNAREQAALADLAGKSARDPQAASALLDQGLYDSLLSPEQRDQAARENAVAVSRADALVRQQQAAGLAQAREMVATAKAQIANGDTIDAATLAQARDALRASGDTSTAESANGLIAQDQFAKQYLGQTPLQMNNRLAVLQAKDNRTKSENLELNYLQSAAPGRASAFREDSAGYFARYGTGNLVPPPLNLADPQSVQARVAWNRRVSGAAGQQINVLTKDEAWSLQQAAQQGAAGRQSVLASLDAIPDQERYQAAMQIMPGDAGFRHESQLSPEVRRYVFEGREVLKANVAFLKPDTKTMTGVQASRLLGVLGAELQKSLGQMDPADLEAVKRSAGEWLAGNLSGHSRAADSLTPWDIRQAATYALGGKFMDGRQYGGLGRWHGDNVFVVPESMSEMDFVTAVYRDRWAKFHAGHGPTMALENAHPVWIGPAKYRWETAAGRTVRDVHGHDFITDLGGGQ
ncbi:hypothetical protein [Novosphingobium sp. FKTRR1]|uniref:hypothetical protein n=1 Tax=Novosphingobium sp. FKTRR1 TaxID=2879118 RepID=UPI001CEFBB00|nr:hypothetical protein [Novosphingobium sp. FKTRR1]